MKKQLLLGMVLVCGVQMSFASGTGKGVEIARKGITEGINRVEATRVDLGKAKEMSHLLSQIAGSSREAELEKALVRSIQVKDASGTKTISLMSIAKFLVDVDNNLRTKSTAGADPAHLAATREAVKVASEFLSLAVRTSETNSVMSEQQKLEVAAFNKQISLIEKMVREMDTADLQAHTEVMRKAVSAKTSPKIDGDQALASVLKAGKSQEDYLQKLNDLIGCI